MRRPRPAGASGSEKRGPSFQLSPKCLQNLPGSDCGPSSWPLQRRRSAGPLASGTASFCGETSSRHARSGRSCQHSCGGLASVTTPAGQPGPRPASSCHCKGHGSLLRQYLSARREARAGRRPGSGVSTLTGRGPPHRGLGQGPRGGRTGAGGPRREGLARGVEQRRPTMLSFFGISSRLTLSPFKGFLRNGPGVTL